MSLMLKEFSKLRALRLWVLSFYENQQGLQTNPGRKYKGEDWDSAHSSWNLRMSTPAFVPGITPGNLSHRDGPKDRSFWHSDVH